MSEFNRWKKSLESINKLSFEEAQELYKDYINEKDNNKKIEKRNTLAEGLLHYTIDIAEKRYTNNSVYKLLDEDELISLSINYLIKSIQDGKLLTIKNIGELYQNDYTHYIFNSNEKNHSKYETVISTDTFTKMFMLYIEKRKNGEVNYEEYIRDFLKMENSSSLDEYCHHKDFTSNDISNTFINFEKLYKSLENKETGQVNITQTEVREAKHALYEKMTKISEKTERFGVDKKLDDVEYKQVFSKIEELMDKGLTEEQKQVLLVRFGIDGKGSKTCDETAKLMGITPERVREIESKALRKLRKNEELEEMRKDLGHPVVEEPEVNSIAM